MLFLGYQNQVEQNMLYGGEIVQKNKQTNKQTNHGQSANDGKIKVLIFNPKRKKVNFENNEI